MCTCARLVCVFTLLATSAAAQSTTEDGIRAMLRGEYQAAARVLRPLADDTARPDPVAQFFLAILYDTGQGVQRDEARACGLFLRASRRAHPFSEQSAAIAAFMREQLGGAASLLCVADESWQGGPTQSFVLGPSHRVAFADTSISVTYGDQEQRTPLLLSAGAAYLPIQYTTLAVTRPTVARRHFFQWFVWMPGTTRNPSSWTLSWALSEVVGDRWIPITGEKSLVEVNSPTRPASYDLANLVRLRINASGEAEFIIVSGPVARTEVIPWQGNR
jgi:hypothetical protein